jgi:hypothetical protein
MARMKGSLNFKNKVLIQLIGELLPNGEYGWQAVATACQDRTKEEALRNSTDIKMCQIENLCNNMKRPMGWMGEDGDQIHQCIAIEKKIMKKTHSGLLGFSSDEGSIHSDRDTESTGRGGSQGGLYELIIDLEYNDKGNAIAASAPVNMLSAPPLLPPLHHSPHCSPKQFPMLPMTMRYNSRIRM